MAELRGYSFHQASLQLPIFPKGLQILKSFQIFGLNKDTADAPMSGFHRKPSLVL